jgi:hypothetical protein
MDVFLVPVGPAGHELYCEVPDDPGPTEAPQKGIVRTLVQRFRDMIAAAERDRRARLAGVHVEEGAPGWWGRMKGRTLRWVAETVAEQRLLWHLRRCPGATLVHAADVADEDARGTLRLQLGRDLDKHKRWLILNILGLLAAIPLTPIPGPNLFSWYFSFRIVGHYLSIRGARQGLDVTAWTLRRSAELSELRQVASTHTPDRGARLRDLEGRLGLEHLASFVERVTAQA